MVVRNGFLSWLTLFRLGAVARGVLPFLLGVFIAWSQGYDINVAVLLVSTIAVALVMLMTFLVNEYYDYDTDVINKDYHSLSGGSRVLVMGLIPRRYALIAAFICFLLAGALGLLLHFHYRTGPLTLPLGILAVLIGYFYTGKPVQLAYHGWGEIAIWFSCGWLATMTGYYLQTGRMDTTTTLVSLPGATSVFLVILMNEIPDIKSDRMSGKNNLAVRLGTERSIVLYTVLLLLCYLNIVIIAFFGVPKISAMLSVVLLPLIIWNIVTLKRKGLASRRAQEAMSLRTMLIDHLITIIYVITFMVEGLGGATVPVDKLIVLAVVFMVVFALEGVSVLCSKLVTAAA
ncbi:MAG: prenyltransferase [Dehalococcoidales bacterium]|nr:prenyltransferase [Dehalococcoidales bacterium]